MTSPTPVNNCNNISVSRHPGYKIFTHRQPFLLKYNDAVLSELKIAYETWGKITEAKDNVVLIFSSLTLSSHVRSNEINRQPGWWERFLGSGCAVDTDKFYVICSNPLGSCYGTTGPSSINPSTGKPYGTSFPIISVVDIVNAQFLLLDYLGIQKVHTCIGFSLAGMCSLAAAALWPDRVGRIIGGMSCVQSFPSLIATNHLQRQCIMTDINWRNGHYYDGEYPLQGMKLAREIAMLTYRNGPEFEERFGRKKAEIGKHPSLSSEFLVETYLEYKGESFSHVFDPNSLIYLLKALDLFDLSEGFSSMEEAVSNIQCPVLVIGVKSDTLFPVKQQQKLTSILLASGNSAVTFFELDSPYGHDSFLLDVEGMGEEIKEFLESN